MKIGLTTTEYWEGRETAGGVGSSFAAIAETLVADKHDVTVFLKEKTNDIRKGIHGERVVSVNPAKFDDNRNHEDHYQVAAKAIARCIGAMPTSDRPDVVLAASNRGLGAFICEFVDARLIVRLSSHSPTWLANNGEPEDGLQSKRLEIEERAISTASAIFAPSQFVAQLAMRDLNKFVPVIRTPLGGEIWRLSRSLRQKRYHRPISVLYCSALEANKGLLTFVGAVRALFEKGTKLTVLFAAPRDSRLPSGEFGSDFVRLELNLWWENVKLHVGLPRLEMLKMMSEATVVVIPSIADNLPNVLLESLALGKVIICSNGASLNEVVQHGISGFLFESNDEDALESMLVHALSRSRATLSSIEDEARSAAFQTCSPQAFLDKFVPLCNE
jgi:glycosyltransferase involved in cell wall biosynthesis